jgi:hypothetical protein
MTKSKIVSFPGHSRNGKNITTYIALHELNCSNCQIDININEIFSRSSSKNGEVDGIRYILCSSCRPFSENKLVK